MRQHIAKRFLIRHFFLDGSWGDMDWVRSKIMDFVKQKVCCRRIDIVRYLKTEVLKKDFDPKRDRGYFSRHFSKPNGLLLNSTEDDPRYLKQLKNKKYCVRVDLNWC